MQIPELQPLIDLFFSDDRPVALAVNLTLVVLTIAASGQAIRHWLTLGRERAAIASIDTASLPAESDEAGGREGKPSANQEAGRERLERAATRLPSGVLIQKRIYDLRRMGERDQVDVAGLSSLSREELRDAVAFPVAVGPTLVLLGLLGTLWGLAESVASLSASMASADAGSFSVAALRGSIITTLGGMKTAFSTTLLGILGTVTVRTIAGFVRHGQSRLLQDLERLMITSIVPLYEVSERTALPQAAAHLESLVDHLEKRGEELSNELVTRFNRMETLFQERARELLAETGRATQELLKMLGSRDANDPSLADYVRTVESTTDRLMQSVQAAGRMIPELEATLQRSIEEQGQSLVMSLTQYSEKIGPVLNDQAEASRQLLAAATSNNESMLALRDQLTSLSTSFEKARESWERIDGLVERVGDACSTAITSGLQQVVQDVGEQARENDDERERVALALAQLQRSVNESLAHLREERSAVQNRSLEMLETTKDVTTSGLARMLTSMEAVQQTSTREFVTAIRGLEKEIRDLHLRRDEPGAESAVGSSRPDFRWDSFDGDGEVPSEP